MFKLLFTILKSFLVIFSFKLNAHVLFAYVPPYPFRHLTLATFPLLSAFTGAAVASCFACVVSFPIFYLMAWTPDTVSPAVYLLFGFTFFFTSRSTVAVENVAVRSTWSVNSATQCEDSIEKLFATIAIVIGGIVLFAYYAGVNDGIREERMRLMEKAFEEALVRGEVLKRDVSEARKTTKADLSPDLDFINALIEQDTVANIRYGILALLALSSLGVYSIILAGWSSNSKYAFIGALRSAAQMISYEVAISLIILPIVLFSGSLNLSIITYVQHMTTWFLWPLLPNALLFLVAMLAETNRTPFDLPEAEAELVAGYNVDYSSLPFAMFFLGEYCNMILISTLYCLLFLAGGLNRSGLYSAFLLSAKASVTWVFFVLVRATLPRYRYDQLMDIGWKVFLPVSGSFLLYVFGLLVFFSALVVANELPLNFRVPLLQE